MIEISVNNRQQRHAVNRQRLIDAARLVLRGEGFEAGEISLAVVDDLEMRSLNRRHLNHDYATDVLSFPLDSHERTIVGEIIVSADTAAEAAGGMGTSVMDELLLYVVHGALHLAGHDDHSPADVEEMRRLEARYLRSLGATVPFPSDQPGREGLTEVCLVEAAIAQGGVGEGSS